MTTTLTVSANEESTYVITMVFTDEDGAELTPTSLTWTLTDLDGTVINSRQDVVISSPASTTNVVLSGDDLALNSESNSEEVRVFTVEGTYTSTYGSGLPIKEQVYFNLDNLVAV